MAAEWLRIVVAAAAAAADELEGDDEREWDDELKWDTDEACEQLQWGGKGLRSAGVPAAATAASAGCGVGAGEAGALPQWGGKRLRSAGAYGEMWEDLAAAGDFMELLLEDAELLLGLGDDADEA
jgi:hypothetical protein